MLTEVKHKKIFVNGPINPAYISELIMKHQSKMSIGAHNIFLWQIRNDEAAGKQVRAIEYSAYEEMAEKVFEEIKEKTFQKFDIICLHIYHSRGIVKAGEISLFVFVSSAHRRDSYKACEYVVDEIKKKVPIFGKELFEDNTFQWKS